MSNENVIFRTTTLSPPILHYLQQANGTTECEAASPFKIPYLSLFWVFHPICFSYLKLLCHDSVYPFPVWHDQEWHGLEWHPTSECSDLEWLQVFHHLSHDLEFHPSVWKQGWWPIKYNANVDRSQWDARVT